MPDNLYSTLSTPIYSTTSIKCNGYSIPPLSTRMLVNSQLVQWLLFINNHLIIILNINNKKELKKLTKVGRNHLIVINIYSRSRSSNLFISSRGVSRIFNNIKLSKCNQ